MFVWPPHVRGLAYESSTNPVGPAPMGTLGQAAGALNHIAISSPYNTYLRRWSSWEDLLNYTQITSYSALVPFYAMDTYDYTIYIDPGESGSPYHHGVWHFPDFTTPTQILTWPVHCTGSYPGYFYANSYQMFDGSTPTPQHTIHPTYEMRYSTNYFVPNHYVVDIIRCAESEYWFVYIEYDDLNSNIYTKAVKRTFGTGGGWGATHYTLLTEKDTYEEHGWLGPNPTPQRIRYAGNGWGYMWKCREWSISDQPPIYEIIPVDFTTTPPTLHTKLDIPALGTGQYGDSLILHEYNTYVEVDGDRVMCFAFGTTTLGPNEEWNCLIILRYTATTVANPRIAFFYMPDSMIHYGWSFLTHDPVDKETYFILAQHVSTAGWSSVDGSCIRLTLAPSVWADPASVSTQLASSDFAMDSFVGNRTQLVTHPVTGSGLTVNDPRTSSMLDGEAHHTLLYWKLSVSSPTSYYPARAILQFWHDPQDYEAGIDCTSTYPSVSLSSRKRRRVVGLDTTTTTYCMMDVQVARSYAGTFAWEMTASGGTNKTAGIDATNTYSYVTIDAVKLSMVTQELTQYYPIIGTVWMTDFMGYVNADRAAVGLPPYKIFGDDGQFLTKRDIANLHTCNMANFRIYAHESQDFPQNQRTIAERLGIMNAGYGAENIQIVSTWDLLNNSTLGFPTPYTAYLNWHNSPPHYANIIRDYGPVNNEKAYSLLSVAEARFPYAYPQYAQYLFAYLCNNFVVLEDTVVTATLTQFWDNEGALISQLSQQWPLYAYVPVSAEHEALFGISVSQAQEYPYGCRTAASLEAPIRYSVQVEHSSPYTSTENLLKVQHQAGYSINEYEYVAAEHSSLWGVSVSAENEANFNYQVAARAAIDASYNLENYQPARAEHGLSYGLMVSSACSMSWSMHARVAGEHEAPYGGISTVAAQMSYPYQMLTRNPVRKAMIHYYRLQASV